jgi:hypothetical protein
MEKVIINPEIEYFIVSLKHTGKKDKYITLWRPSNAGYCWPVELAGRYQGFQLGYHNSEANVPIPTSELPIKFLVKDGNGRDCIANNKASVAFMKLYIDSGLAIERPEQKTDLK